MRFQPTTSTPRERPIAAVDVEGDAQRGMVTACIVTEDGAKIYNSPEQLAADLSARRMRGVHIYSHKLTYDAGVLVPWLPEDTQLLFIGSRLFKGRLSYKNNNTVYLNDSCNLWNGQSLTDVGKEVGMERLPPPSSIMVKDSPTVPRMIEGVAKEVSLEEYTQREAQITYEGVRLLQGEILALGGQLRDTLASTAMDLFRRRYLDAEYYTPFLYRSRFARKAYYGGRCECYVLGWWSNVNFYDFNSHYPSRMVGHDYPNPNTLIGPTCRTDVKLVMEHEGVSRCKVYVPYMKYPPLPYKSKAGILYPVGEFEGVWCHNELRYAVEQGVKIVEVYDTLYSEDSVRPFDTYVADLWTRRQELRAEGSPRAAVYKLLLNSLSGKFGQREDGCLTELCTWDAYEEMGYPNGAESMVIMGEVYARVPIPVKSLPRHAIVPWAAYITSYGRISLHRAMMQVSGPVLYCDTDSLAVFSDLPTGKGLGELSLKHKDVSMDVIAAKMYQVVTPEGETHAVAKGVPPEVAGDYCTYKAVEYWKALNWQESVRLKLSPGAWVEVKKFIRHHNPRRRYKPIEGFKGDVCISEPLRMR